MNIITEDWGNDRKPNTKKQINYKVQRINNDRNVDNDNVCGVCIVDVETRPRQVGCIMENFILLNPNVYWVMAMGLAMWIVLKWK